MQWINNMRIIIVLAIISLGFMPDTYSQTDFHTMEKQFWDYYESGKLDSALYSSRRMNNLALTEYSDSSYWFALSEYCLGYPFYSRGEFDSTLFYWEQSIELFEKYHSDSSDYIVGLENIGNLYDEIGQY